jgi:hypothetical protein
VKILVGCEFSGIVTEAFRKKGHDSWSCDLLPSEGTPYHIQADLSDLQGSKEWDMVMADQWG